MNETDLPCLFDLHQNPNDKCIVGRHIRPVLSDMFAELEAGFSAVLADKTLADCIRGIRERLDDHEQRK